MQATLGRPLFDCYGPTRNTLLQAVGLLGRRADLC
jgi:hypothetical protein